MDKLSKLDNLPVENISLYSEIKIFWWIFHNRQREEIQDGAEEDLREKQEKAWDESKDIQRRIQNLEQQNEEKFRKIEGQIEEKFRRIEVEIEEKFRRFDTIENMLQQLLEKANNW